MMSGAAVSDGIWLSEQLAPGHVVNTRVTDIYHRSKSEFQDIAVVNLSVWGRTLMLDNVLQSGEVDEFIYHETLVHPAMMAHGNPKSVYIGGGGEGATAREALRFKSAERVVMVDIDGVCVEACKKYMDCHHKGSFDDPRLELVIGCARAYLEKNEEKFDVIIMDLADPLEVGPCWELYTKEFYSFVATKLNPGGVFVTQCGQAGLTTASHVFSPVRNTMMAVFPHVRSYISYVGSFADTYGFTLASSDVDLNKLTAEVVEKKQDAVTGENKYYDGETHNHMFSIPKYVRKIFQEEVRVGTLANPQSFYVS